MELYYTKPTLHHSQLWSLVCMWLFLYTLQVRGDAMTPETCNARTSTPCQAMIGYVSPNNYNLSEIALLFSTTYASLLGPNDIDPSLQNLSKLVLPAFRPHLVRQTCGCSVNGTRVVTSANYTVVNGDTLSTIADPLYAGLVTYEEIAAANDIANPNLIIPGQNFTIPIPCGCFTQSNGGQPAIFLSYQVQVQDSISSIAEAYNTSATQLENLNSLRNSSITATSVLFVPLSVCKANFSSNALDKDLTVLESKYELTANGCVQCNCNNGTLHCVKAPSSLGNSCSNTTCSTSSIPLGASTKSQGNGECTVRSCVYKGYTAQSIISVLETEEDRSCPVALPPETYYKPPSDLVASPLHTMPEGPSTTTTPPPPPSSTAVPPTSNTSSPNSATILLVGISSFSWWWPLLAASILLHIPSITLMGWLPI